MEAAAATAAVNASPRRCSAVCRLWSCRKRTHGGRPQLSPSWPRATCRRTRLAEGLLNCARQRSTTAGQVQRCQRRRQLHPRRPTACPRRSPSGWRQSGGSTAAAVGPSWREAAACLRGSQRNLSPPSPHQAQRRRAVAQRRRRGRNACQAARPRGLAARRRPAFLPTCFEPRAVAPRRSLRPWLSNPRAMGLEAGVGGHHGAGLPAAAAGRRRHWGGGDRTLLGHWGHSIAATLPHCILEDSQRIRYSARAYKRPRSRRSAASSDRQHNTALKTAYETLRGRSPRSPQVVAAWTRPWTRQLQP